MVDFIKQCIDFIKPTDETMSIINDPITYNDDRIKYDIYRSVMSWEITKNKILSVYNDSIDVIKNKIYQIVDDNNENGMYMIRILQDILLTFIMYLRIQFDFMTNGVDLYKPDHNKLTYITIFNMHKETSSHIIGRLKSINEHLIDNSIEFSMIVDINSTLSSEIINIIKIANTHIEHYKNEYNNDCNK